MIFSEFEGNMPETVAGDGDVKYHLGFSADHTTQHKHTVHLTLTPNPSHLEAVNPVVEGRMRAKQRRHPDKGPQARSADPDPRRRRLRRPGPGGRDLEPLATAGLSDRRHDPHRGQQPDRLHDLAERGPLDPLLHRRGQDDRGADLPRQRRGPRGGRLRRRAGHRLPPDLRPGRGHRHDLLPPPRPQRGRRAGVHPAAHVREDPQPDQHPRALHRAARHVRRALQPGGRDHRRDLRREDAGGLRGGQGAGRRAAYHPSRLRHRPLGQPHPPVLVRDRTRPASRTTCSGRSPKLRPGPRPASSSTPSCRGSSPPGSRPWSRAARSTGRSPRTWPSARSCSRAPRSGSAARTAAAGPSASGTPCWSTSRPASAGPRSITWRRASPSSASTTACSPRRPCSGSTTATRWTSPTC